MATIAVDLDNTLVRFGKHPSRCGDWIPGAQQFLHEMSARGVRVIIHTCRVTWPEGGGYQEVARVLQDAYFVPQPIVSTDQQVKPGHIGVWMGQGKPVAELYVDDRGFRFEGNWDAVLEAVV